MRLKPFRAWRPPADRAKVVSCPPYDVVTTEEARALAQDCPECFLHVTRSEIDLPPGTDPYAPEVYEQAARAFQAFKQQGYLTREDRPALYVYRLSLGEHTQNGVVGLCHVQDYETGVIRRHEETREDKEEDRARHIEATGAHCGLVYLAYRPQPEIQELVAEIQTASPLYDFVARDGVRHTVWRVLWSEGLAGLFAGVPTAYIADGHHRAAAAARLARRRDAARPPADDPEYRWFPAALFPSPELKILPYHRCVRDLAGRSPRQFLETLRRHVEVTEHAEPEPRERGEVAMYLAGRWYRLRWPTPTSDDPVGGLDVSVLQEKVLKPLLGIEDPRRDPRLDFVGGKAGATELVRRVDSGEAAVAFALYPISIETLMAAADAGRTLPPKSTWFEPKLRSGLLVHTLE